MKRIVLCFAIVALAIPAHAINRYDTQRMTCERVQAVLESEGVAILRYPSPRSAQLTLYDLYAKDSRFCEDGQVARPAVVPTRNDRRCRVRRCQSRSHGGDQ